MGKPGPMQTPITARIKRTTQGGMTTQPILNMGAPVKMKRTPAKKSLVGNQDQLPANLQADIKAAPGKMYKSPARVDKAAEAKRKKAISKGLDNQKVEGYLNDSAFNDSNMDGTMASRAIKGLYRAGKKAAMIATGGPAGVFMAKAEGIKNRIDDTNNYNNLDYAKFKGDNPDLFKSGGGTEDSVKVDPKKTTKSYVKKGGTATGNMKDYKIGSQKRRDEYTARGWKQDKTTAVKGGAKTDTVKEIKITTKVDPTKKITKVDPTKKTTKVTTTKNTKVTSAPKETSKRASKLRAKGNAQLAAGDNKGALATKRKYDKKNKKVASKTKKGTNRVEYDESTGKGGSVLGNALRSVTGKRKRDKAAAERRKNAPGTGSMMF